MSIHSCSPMENCMERKDLPLAALSFLFALNILKNPGKVMNRRRDERYSPQEAIYIETDLEGIPCRGTMRDLSLRGMGAEFPGLTGDQYGTLRALDEFFLKIYIGEDFILTGVKAVWRSHIVTEEGFTYRGGMVFTIVAPEDMLRISALVDELLNSCDRPATEPGAHPYILLNMVKGCVMLQR